MAEPEHTGNPATPTSRKADITARHALSVIALAGAGLCVPPEPDACAIATYPETEYPYARHFIQRNSYDDDEPRRPAPE
jgi:hypothetical protein